MGQINVSDISEIKQEGGYSPEKQSQPSNGFLMRHIDLNIANRIYKSFPQMPVDSETVEKIIKNFPNERGVWIAPNRPYLSTAYIPYVDGFLDYSVKNDLGTGLTEEAYQQRRKAFIYNLKISPFGRNTAIWNEAYKLAQIIEGDILSIEGKIDKLKKKMTTIENEERLRTMQEEVERLKKEAEEKRRLWMAYINLITAKENLQKEFDKQIEEIRETVKETSSQEFRQLLEIMDKTPETPELEEIKAKIVGNFEERLDKALFMIGEYYKTASPEDIYSLDIKDDKHLRQIIRQVAGKEAEIKAVNLWEDFYKPLALITPDDTGERKTLLRAFKREIVINALVNEYAEKEIPKVLETYTKVEEEIRKKIAEKVKEFKEKGTLEEYLVNLLLKEKKEEEFREAMEKRYNRRLKRYRENKLSPEETEEFIVAEELMKYYRDLDAIAKEKEELENVRNEFLKKGLTYNYHALFPITLKDTKDLDYAKITEAMKELLEQHKEVEKVRKEREAQNQPFFEKEYYEKYPDYFAVRDTLRTFAQELYSIEGILRASNNKLIETAGKRWNLDLLMEKLNKGKIPIEIFRDKYTLASLLGEDPASNLVRDLQIVAENIKDRKLNDMFKKVPLNTADYLSMLREMKTWEYMRNILSRQRPKGEFLHDKLLEKAERLEKEGKTKVAGVLRTFAPAIYGFSSIAGGMNTNLMTCIEQASFPSDTGLDTRASARLRDCMEKYFREIETASHRWEAEFNKIAQPNPLNVFRFPYTVFALYMSILRGMQGAYWRSHYNYFRKELSRKADRLIYLSPEDIDARMKEEMYKITGIKAEVKPIYQLSMSEFDDQLIEPRKEAEQLRDLWKIKDSLPEEYKLIEEVSEKINSIPEILEKEKPAYREDRLKEVLKSSYESLDRLMQTGKESEALSLLESLEKIEKALNSEKRDTKEINELIKEFGNKTGEFLKSITEMPDVRKELINAYKEFRNKGGKTLLKLSTANPEFRIALEGLDYAFESLEEGRIDTQTFIFKLKDGKFNRLFEDTLSKYAKDNSFKIMIRGEKKDTALVFTINADRLRELGEDDLIDKVANAKNKEEAKDYLLHYFGLLEETLKDSIDRGLIRNGMEDRYVWRNVMNALASKLSRAKTWDKEEERKISRSR